MQSTHVGVPPHPGDMSPPCTPPCRSRLPSPPLSCAGFLPCCCLFAIRQYHSPGAGCHLLPSSGGGHTVHPGWDILACVNATNPCRAQSLALPVEAQHLNANCTRQRGRERVTDCSYKEKQFAIRTTQMKLLEFLIADKAFPQTA